MAKTFDYVIHSIILITTILIVALVGIVQAAVIFDPALSGLRFDGAVLSGGKMYFYEPGTTTLRTVYANRTQTITASNPVTIDSNGQGKVYLDGVYDVVVKSSSGAIKATWPSYTSLTGTITINDAGADGGTWNAPTTEPETTVFISRVQSDGGTIVNAGAIDAAVKKAKADGYWSSTKAAYSPNWAVKGSSTVSKLYSLTGATYDLVQATAGKEPALTGGYIRLDAATKWLSASFAFVQPEVVVAAVKAVSWTPSRYLWDGNSLNKMVLGQIGPEGLDHTKLQSYAGAWVGNEYPNIKSTYHLHTGQLSIITAKYNGNDSYIKTNNLLKSTANGGSLAADGFTLGSTSNISANVDIGEVWLLSTGQDTLIEKAAANLNTIYTAYGSRDQIVFEGDSLTYGSAATNPYPSQTMVLLGAGWDWYNLGRAGYGISIMYTDAATRVDSLIVQNKKNILVAWGGTNDLVPGSEALGIQVYNTYKLYCQERKAAGWKVVAATMLPRQDPNVADHLALFEEGRTAFNNLVRTDLINHVDGLIDGAADARLQDPTNMTYFATDLVHTNNTGAGVMAELAEPIIAAQ